MKNNSFPFFFFFGEQTMFSTLCTSPISYHLQYLAFIITAHFLCTPTQRFTLFVLEISSLRADKAAASFCNNSGLLVFFPPNAFCTSCEGVHSTWFVIGLRTTPTAHRVKRFQQHSSLYLLNRLEVRNTTANRSDIYFARLNVIHS